jgi:hypothetical protein
MARACSTHGEDSKCVMQMSQRHLSASNIVRCILKENTAVDLKECGDAYWTDLAWVQTALVSSCNQGNELLSCYIMMKIPLPADLLSVFQDGVSPCESSQPKIFLNRVVSLL